MSQEQPQRPKPVRYGDVLHVQGELASKPVAPQDAAAFTAAENIALGKIQEGGPAAVVQSAAEVNETRGVVHHDDMTNIVKEEGVTISEADAGGYSVVTEAIGGQVVALVGQYVQPGDVGATGIGGSDAITIGEALEATAFSVGNKPIDESDAAAIQAAEIRATGLGHAVTGGVAAEAQSAAAYNARKMRDEDKTKLGDVLIDAATKITNDKPVTREEAESVIGAEIRNKADMCTHPGGVAASMAAATRLNQQNEALSLLLNVWLRKYMVQCFLRCRVK